MFAFNTYSIGHRSPSCSVFTQHLTLWSELITRSRGKQLHKNISLTLQQDRSLPLYGFSWNTQGAPAPLLKLPTLRVSFQIKRFLPFGKNLPSVSSTASLLSHVSWYKIRKGNARSVHYRPDPDSDEVHGSQRAGIASRGNKLFSPQTPGEDRHCNMPKETKTLSSAALINIWEKGIHPNPMRCTSSNTEDCRHKQQHCLPWPQPLC